MFKEETLFFFLFFYWGIIALQNFVVFCQTSTWISHAAAKSLQSCRTLCDPIDGSPPGSTIPGILQARTLEWVAISFSNAWKWKVKVKSVVQSCPTLSDPMDCSPPGSSIHGVFQARLLEWVANAFPVCICMYIYIYIPSLLNLHPISLHIPPL